MNDEILVSPIEDTEFHIVDEHTASWYVGKITMMRQEIEMVKSQAARRIASIESNIKGMEFRFGKELEQWASMESAKRGKKTLRLVDGTVRIVGRPLNPKAKVSDLTKVPFKDEFEVVAYDIDGIERHATSMIKLVANKETGELVPTLNVPGFTVIPATTVVTIVNEKADKTKDGGE